MLMNESLFGFQPRRPFISMPHGLLIIPLVLALAGCAGEGAGGADPNSGLAHADGGDVDPVVTMTPTATGVTAQVSWDPPPNFKAAGYDFYYGKRSSDEVTRDEVTSDEPPSCTHGDKQTVDGPEATITGLERNAQYFFVIRAFNEDQSETICSNEFTAETTPSQS